jgi:hypothetical protein
LIEHEFLTRDQLEAALVYLQDGGRKPRPKAVMQAVEIVGELKRESL